MKRFLLTLLSAAALLVCACDKYDDTALRNELSGLEDRVANLEDLCSKLNTNIASIQTLLENLNAKIAIERVLTLDNGEGYLITFSNGSSITVYNGVDGQAGAKGEKGEKGEQGEKGEKGDQGDPGTAGETPVVGVKDDGGVLYWTLNGDWLLDAEGNKIPVVGEKGDAGDPGADGNDGVTPQLKIEDGKWMVSTDNGETWEEVETSGDDAYNTMALTIEETEESFIITLNGETYEISKSAAAATFQIKVDNDDVTLTGQSVTLTYTLTGADETTHVVAEGNVPSELDESACTLTISGGAETEGYVILRAIRNSDGAYSAQYIAVAGGMLTILTGEEVTVAGDGETFEVQVKTNLDYTVTLPDWITEDPETKAVRTDTKSFTAAANITGEERTATLTFKTSDGSIEKAVVVKQEKGSQVGDGSLENPFNVAAAIAVTKDLTWTSNTVYDKVGPYYVKGVIKSIASNGQYGAQFGNATFFIQDEGADNEFEAYRVLYLENQKWVEGNTQIKVGDEVILYGELMNYRGNTPETVQNSAYLYSLNGATKDEGSVDPGDDPGDEPDDPDDPGEADGDFASSISWTLGSSAYDQAAVINGEEVGSVLKLGTASKAGDATLTIPSGVTKIGFYAVAWKGSGTVDIDFGGKTVTAAANDGATGNPTYTINVSDSDYYEVDVSGSSVTISAAKRVIIFGINAK